MSAALLAEPSRALAVRVEGAEKSFAGRSVLRGLSFEIRVNEFVAEFGASGSCKTTFLRVLSGVLPLDGGSAWVPERRSVVFQEARLIPNRRVFENVTLGQGKGLNVRGAAESALQEVGLGALKDAWPETLSGGEAQRVALARALVRTPELLLLDEPFSALDALTRIKMHELVAKLCARHRPAVLLVTHDVDEAILLADRVVVLREGTLSLDVSVPLPRPRTRGGEGFVELRRRLLAELGVSEAVG